MSAFDWLKSPIMDENYWYNVYRGDSSLEEAIPYIDILISLYEAYSANPDIEWETLLKIVDLDIDDYGLYVNINNVINSKVWTSKKKAIEAAKEFPLYWKTVQLNTKESE